MSRRNDVLARAWNPRGITEMDRTRGRWLCALRQTTGMSPGELADESGMSEETIRLYESGRHVMKANTPIRKERMTRLAATLGVSVEELMLEM